MRKLQNLRLRSAGCVTPVELFERLDAGHRRESRQGCASTFIATEHLALEQLLEKVGKARLGLGRVLRQARPLAREPYELQLLAELRDPCILDRHATILSSSSYTDSGCCKLSIGVATRRPIIGGAFRAGAGSMTARSSGRSFIGATPVVPWMRTFATSSSHRRTWRLATSTSSRRPLASRLEASGSTKLPFRYELKRSTLPFVLARYGRHNRGVKPQASASSFISSFQRWRPA